MSKKSKTEKPSKSAEKTENPPEETKMSADDKKTPPEEIKMSADDKKTPPEEESSPFAETAIATLTSNLPAEMVANVTRLLTIMNPNKLGFEEMGGAQLRPPVVKLHQKMTNEAPEDSKPGMIFTDTGEVLEAPFKFVPLKMFYTQVRFRENEMSPSCRSEDTETSVYGNPCKDCVDLPFRGGQPTDCTKQINVFAVNAEFSQLYHLQFSKTSFRAGSNLFRQASSTVVPWERVYNLSTAVKERKVGGGQYWVFSANAAKDPVTPELQQVARRVFDVVEKSRAAYMEKVREQASAGEEAVDNLGDDIGNDSIKPDKDSSDGGGKFGDL